MMRQKLCLMLSIVALLSGMAAAEMLGVDLFDYPDGAIAGKNEGTYWNRGNTGLASWVKRDGNTDIVGGTLVTDNGAASRAYGLGAWDTVMPVKATGVVYIRVRVTPLTAQSEFGVCIDDFDNPLRLLMGMPETGTGQLGTFGFDDRDPYPTGRVATGVTRSTTPVVLNQSYVLMCAVDYRGGQKQARVWINPNASEYDNGTADNSADMKIAFTGEAWNTGVRLTSKGQVRWDDLAVATSSDTSAFKEVMKLFPTSGPTNLAPVGKVYKPLYIPSQLTWDAPAWGEALQSHIVSISYKLEYYSRPTSTATAKDPNFLDPTVTITTVANATSPHPMTFDFATTYCWRVTATTTWDSATITGSLTDTDSVQERFDVQPANTAPIPNAGKGFITWLAKAQSGTVQLDGSVLDADGDATTVWTAYRNEFGSVAPTPDVVFADKNNPKTAVTISAVGEYILRLMADDAAFDPSSSQTTIVVYADACTAAKKNPAGYTKDPYDFNDNCQVDVADLLMLAGQWLNSTEATKDVYFAATVSDPRRALLVEYWTNVTTGSDPNVILLDPRYPDSPTGKGLTTDGFKQGGRNLDNFSQRIRGYIVPPATGSYIFYIASDDSSDLMLSTDATVANAVKIAKISGNTGADNWKDASHPEQVSKPVNLTKDAYYYVEVLHKENTGGEHVSVAWSTDGGTTRTLVPASALRWYLP